MESKVQIVCFGETLWDIFPEGERIGGAPLNVAYHLSRLGTREKVISRVGRDNLGKRLVQQVRDWGMDRGTIQEDQKHSTSTVLAHVGEKGETTYEIVKPVAWDFIEWEEGFSSLSRISDAVVFGSLAFRSPDSRETLLQIIENSKFSVFDVNLRPPHFEKEQILAVLEKVDLLKLNHDELEIIANWLNRGGQEEECQVEYLRQQFSIGEVLVTKGGKGARYFTGELDIEVSAFPIEVVNTVGSGDAFLAAFLNGKFEKSFFSVREQLGRAALLGAFVASKDRACPIYQENDLLEFKRNIDKK